VRTGRWSRRLAARASPGLGEAGCRRWCNGCPVLLIVAVVCFLVLPAPWDAVAFAVFLLGGALEVLFWWRKGKDRRIQTGAEALIGTRAKVISACHPDGQVSAEGAIWSARCESGADPGDTVHVVRRQGLLLIVER
jgi:membrane protein implicated in regulation of membrane protease activity